MDRPFKNPAIAAARKLLTAFGVAATYTPASGDPVSLRVFFNQDVRLQVEGYDSASSIRTKTVEAISSDLAGLDQKGAFLIDSVSYQIVELISDDTERIIFQVK